VKRGGPKQGRRRMAECLKKRGPRVSQGDEGRELKEEEGRGESSKRAVMLKEKREAVGLYGLRASSKPFKKSIQ
jgi:hypothetical protein